MSGICGIFYKKNQQPDARLLTKMLKALDPGNRYTPVFSIRQNAGIGQLYLKNKVPEHKQNPFICGFDMQNDLLKTSSDTSPDKKNTSAESLFALYKSYGESLPEQLPGEFVLALFDPPKNQLFIACDRIGAKPLFYADTGEAFIFASNINAILATNLIHKTTDEEWILDLLSNNISEKHKTHLKHVQRLLPGHWLKVTQDNLTITSYWSLTMLNTMPTDEHEIIHEFQKLLNQAIQRRLPTKMALGCELSGGLDSSLVTAFAHRHAQKQKLPFFTYSHTSPDLTTFPFKDEKEYIEQVNHFLNNPNSRYANAQGKGILEALEFGIKVQGGPTQQRYYEFADALYEIASADGVSTILSGFGGDEMVSSQTPGYFHELASTTYGHFLKELFKSKKSTRGKIRNLLLISLYAKIPGLYAAWTKIGGPERSRLLYVLENSALQKGLIKKYNLLERSMDKSRFPNEPSVATRQYRRVMHPHVPQRMEYTAQAARYFGMEYSYPLLDPDLMQFYYSLPAEIKFKHQVNRYIFREAGKGYIPEKIRFRNDKSGATIPSVHHRFQNDFEQILSFLNQCSQKGIGREFIDTNKMISWAHEIKNRRLDGPPVYQGFFFNYLMFLMYLDQEG